MTGRPLLFVALLGVAVLASAVGVMYSTHASRKLFIELQSLQTARDELNVEWGRLQLEQSTWTTYTRIDDIARRQLNMSIPPPEAVVMVKP